MGYSLNPLEGNAAPNPLDILVSSILIGPVPAMGPVVLRDVRRDLGDGDRQSGCWCCNEGWRIGRRLLCRHQRGRFRRGRWYWHGRRRGGIWSALRWWRRDDARRQCGCGTWFRRCGMGRRGRRRKRCLVRAGRQDHEDRYERPQWESCHSRPALLLTGNRGCISKPQ